VTPKSILHKTLASSRILLKIGSIHPIPNQHRAMHDYTTRLQYSYISNSTPNYRYRLRLAHSRTVEALIRYSIAVTNQTERYLCSLRQNYMQRYITTGRADRFGIEVIHRRNAFRFCTNYTMSSPISPLLFGSLKLRRMQARDTYTVPKRLL
jgi:hypothetical protein